MFANESVCKSWWPRFEVQRLSDRMIYRESTKSVFRGDWILVTVLTSMVLESVRWSPCVWNHAEKKHWIAFNRHEPTIESILCKLSYRLSIAPWIWVIVITFSSDNKSTRVVINFKWHLAFNRWWALGDRKLKKYIPIIYVKMVNFCALFFFIRCILVIIIITNIQRTFGIERIHALSHSHSFTHSHSCTHTHTHAHTQCDATKCHIRQALHIVDSHPIARAHTAKRI